MAVITAKRIGQMIDETARGRSSVAVAEEIDKEGNQRERRDILQYIKNREEYIAKGPQPPERDRDAEYERDV